MCKVFWLDGPATIRIDGDCVRCEFTSEGDPIVVRARLPASLGTVDNFMQAYSILLGQSAAQIVKLGERGPMFLREDHS